MPMKPSYALVLCAIIATSCKGDGDEPLQTGECPVETTATPQVVRLTHLQYDNAVSDVLGVELTLSEAFLDDPVFGGFDNNAAALNTTTRLANDYQRAAEEVAEVVLADPLLLDAILPCTTQDADCATEFIRDLGKSVYRRPLTADEVGRYQTLYEAGADVYETGTPFEQGVRLVVEGMLQSPYFLYRLEVTQQPGMESLKQVPLTGYETATRLAFMLWNAPPDDALLTAAADGTLLTAQGIADQARRMIDDPRAESVIDDFHYQLMDMHKYEDLTRSPTLYPDFDPSMSAAMIEEAQAVIRYHSLYSDGTFADLMTSPVTFANADLARIYGIDPSGFDDELVLTDLDPSQRAGLLTLSGFLASHAYYDISSPIHRGVFIHRNLLCTDIPDPPGDADLELPPLDGKTTREIVEQHTSPQQCTSCHSLINGPGFAFENYDAIGQYRTEENGWPIDATGTTTLEGEVLDYQDGIELSGLLADSRVARKCYLTQWFRYGHARTETEADSCQLNELDVLLQGSDYSIKELIVALTQTESFRVRTVGASQ